ncbi:conserved hypothetical protein [Isorropodon fossajaponicum endosymbiont JTNG4]|uniref:chaperone NapD n=1 Tax=Isorropodon fossajaponicum symbiont TaxID=883811 RepID=UPI001915CD63|nr:chaperone NapD [Isorropodon fossajaponicum symbiont]BBB23731.1 conserved hypothetical protein [Isorropodon fossajaponicum endosymbiont JTNG4]
MKEKDNIDICGVLVQVLKNQTKQVENTLNAIAGVEVHGLSEDNRFVVTIEQDTKTQIISIIESFNTPFWRGFDCVGLSAFRATLGISNDLFTKAVFINCNA